MGRVIVGGLVVTGDGESLLEGVDVLVRDGQVAAIGADMARPDDEVIDARGAVVLPGLVNVHVHGVTPGPLMPSGGRPLPRWKWLANLDRHLVQGTTAVLNLCGLTDMDAVSVANRSHPVRVGGATTHEPLAVSAAVASDGAGVTAQTRSTSVADQLAQGAVAVGELGGGQTLAGGGQDVVYLPEAFAARHDLRIEPWQAKALKEAVLGRSLEWMDESDLGQAAARVSSALEEAGLGGSVDPDDVVALVRSVVMPSLRPALAGIREGIRLAEEHGVPAFVHSAAVTAGLLTELAQRPVATRVVACHVNHPSYLPDEAVALARTGRAAGWANEACVLDLLEQREMVTTREHWDALFDAGDLIDVIATDYGPDGRHDSLLAAVSDLTGRGRLGLAAAVALVTSAPADLVPGLTPTRGRILPGGAADLVLVERDQLTTVREVLVDGVSVVRDGRASYEKGPVLDADQFARLEGAVGADLALADEAVIAESHAGLAARIAALRDWTSR